MKWRGSDFKTKSNQRHDHRDIKNRLNGLGFEVNRDGAELNFTGDSIKQTDSEERECRRHATEEKVFQRRFG